jgi:ATP-dependent Lon protease
MSDRGSDESHEPRVEVLEGDDAGEASEQQGERGIVLARHAYPPRLKIVPLNERPLFPGIRAPLMIDEEPTRSTLIELVQSDEESSYVGALLKRNPEQGGAGSGEQPSADDLYGVGCIAEIMRMGQQGPQSPLQALVVGKDRFRVVRWIRREPPLEAEVEYITDPETTADEELKAYVVSIIQSIKELVKLEPLHKEELSYFMSQSNLNEPGRLADFAAALTTADGSELQEVLEAVEVPKRVEKTLYLLKKEIEIAQLQQQISKQVEEKLSKQQREFFLREQLKAIKKELGLEKDDKETEVERFQQRLEKLTLTEEARGRVDEELSKLRMLEPSSPEFNVTRGYLDWLTVLPWGVHTEDIYDLGRAQKILDRDHYGLQDVKERILEFLSVGIIRGQIAGSILCFVGPPGVGKTSIGRSIAESIGRNFYRFSLGGMRDEAEIKGHRRTYIGAMPGKFIQAIKACGSANPVIMLDEIDKLGVSFRGDPASAMLEVLDPEQNRDFLDHYLDVRFDLSNVFFICTANQMDTIPGPLLDRMEVIKLSGYIGQEKLEIAKRYLVPNALEDHGLAKRKVTITVPALREIIEGYSREPGVRGLEKNIRKIVRKSARRLVSGQDDGKIKIDRDDVAEVLGRRVFSDENRYQKPIPGLVMGLAWTSMGGDTLLIEATGVQAGKAGFKQTGQLGNVMVESAEIAYSYVQHMLEGEKAATEFFRKHFVHVHVPAGATPKDGPSAGITMATALYSLALDKPVRKKVAMTGELTLTGRVMPVGGIKEKVIAAKRAKVKHLVFPEENRKDFEELPDKVRSGFQPAFVTRFDEVVELCF